MNHTVISAAPNQVGTSFFYFEPESLRKISEQHRDAYASARPFPHAVMDSFLPDEALLEKVIEEFSCPEAPRFQHNSTAQRNKTAVSKDYLFGPYTRHLLGQFNSGVFVKFLEALTGIQGLIPDPHYLGGGMHQTYPQGFLKIHTDFSWYPELKLKRRLNLLLYLNRDWKPEYGGDLELWDKEMRHCIRKVSPVFNRCVVFNTSRFSYHGHPEPLNCPSGMTRKSLALYYYTAGDSENRSERFGTLFTKRPREKWFYLRNLIARCLPPIFYEAAIKLDEKIRGIRRI